jgi:hypothetical protein
VAPPIAFGVSSTALLARRKTRTTRDWTPAYAAQYSQGDIVAAWDRTPEKGGQPLGLIRLSRDPYPQRGSEIPDSAFEREGFAYLERAKPLPAPKGAMGRSFWRLLFERWRKEDRPYWVIEFTLAERV